MMGGTVGGVAGVASDVDETTPRHRATARLLLLTGFLAAAVGCAAQAGFVIEDYRFPALTAAPGATISITSTDDEPHTVTADDGSFTTRSFDAAGLGTLVAPTEPGAHQVHCTIHPSMHGTLTVG